MGKVHNFSDFYKKYLSISYDLPIAKPIFLCYTIGEEREVQANEELRQALTGKTKKRNSRIRSLRLVMRIFGEREKGRGSTANGLDPTARSAPFATKPYATTKNSPLEKQKSG